MESELSTFSARSSLKSAENVESSRLQNCGRVSGDVLLVAQKYRHGEYVCYQCCIVLIYIAFFDKSKFAHLNAITLLQQ